jgi:hypothetical protein
MGCWLGHSMAVVLFDWQARYNAACVWLWSLVFAYHFVSWSLDEFKTALATISEQLEQLSVMNLLVLV